MKIELFTFCDFAQENGGKLTIVGTFDTIVSRSFPCVHPQLSVVIRIRFDIWEFSKHSFRIETRDLDGDMNMEAITGNVEVKGVGNATAVSHLVYYFQSALQEQQRHQFRAFSGRQRSGVHPFVYQKRLICLYVIPVCVLLMSYTAPLCAS